mmetsp:Transcript_47898/g.73038  ORF Transcript_47898/g.73038 Transcript_47898/m.73038 type:complete len:540 (-) Transcript_47898:96-1715(-)
MTNEHHDDGGHGHDSDGGKFHVPLYSRPVQRQKWGDHQIHPHANWGDTFFDLFYVAAAYNLGSLIRAEPTSRGVLYFLGCFYPVYHIWQAKMYFDARFYILDDVCHRFYEFAILVLLATAVLHIRPVDILSNPADNVDMFTFCLSVALASFFSCGRLIEVALNVDGQPAAKATARRDLKWNSVPLLFYFAASVASGMAHYSSNDEDDNDGGHRSMAETASSGGGSDNPNDIPVWLCLGGSICSIAMLGLLVLLLPGGGKHKEITVPINVNFAIHRYGEWTMLMLGESVLSLLIVDVTESRAYYKTFFSGIVSITFLEFLHFRSQPHSPDDHALRRSKEAGVLFSTLMQIYSAALVALGTAYKMLLFEYFYEENGRRSYRRLVSSFLDRFLAGSDAPRFDTEDRRQRVANFFCASLAIVWICLDGMILAHRGLKDNVGRCKCSHTGSLRYYALMLFFARVGLIAFIATLSLYVTEPEYLAFVGLLGIMAQVLLRVAGTHMFGEDFEQEEDEFESSSFWPNRTTPQAVPMKADPLQDEDTN